MANFSFGSDPEFMIKDQNGILRSAIPIVLGTNNNRIEINGHGFYHDNVNVEMAINPGNTKNETLNNFRQAFKICADMIEPYKMVIQSSGNYPESELEHPEAKIIGCSPEFCAYELRELAKPISEFESNVFRSAGGHIHLGVKNGIFGDEYGFLFIIRCLDLFLGIPSLWIDQDPTSAARRRIYGSAGSHRWKEYGVEYRALGNFWLANPKLVGLVYDICEFTIDFVNRKQHLNFWSIDEEEIEEGEDVVDCISATGIDQDGLINAINSGNKETAQPFLEIVQKYLPNSIYAEIIDVSQEPPGDFYQAWQI